MNGRALLEDVGASTLVARQIRYEPAESFAEVSLDELEVAIRNLRALAYSCSTGAVHLERIRQGRAGS